MSEGDIRCRSWGPLETSVIDGEYIYSPAISVQIGCFDVGISLTYHRSRTGDDE